MEQRRATMLEVDSSSSSDSDSSSDSSNSWSSSEDRSVVDRRRRSISSQSVTFSYPESKRRKKRRFSRSLRRRVDRDSRYCRLPVTFNFIIFWRWVCCWPSGAVQLHVVVRSSSIAFSYPENKKRKKEMILNPSQDLRVGKLTRSSVPPPSGITDRSENYHHGLASSRGLPWRRARSR